MVQHRALLTPFARRDFRLLFVSQLASDIGDWGARLALSVLLYERTNSAALAVAVHAVTFLPWALAGPFLSKVADRYPRRSVMIVCDLIRGVAFLTLVVALPTPVVLGVVLLASLAAPPYDSARSAALVDIFDDDEDTYGAATTVGLVVGDAGIVVGYAVGGLLIALFGPTGAVLVNAVTFIMSAELTRRMVHGRVAATVDATKIRIRSSVRAFRSDPLLWRAVWLGVITSAAALGVQALLPVLAVNELGAESSAVGILAAASAVATAACGFTLPHAGDHRVLLRAQALICALGGGVAAALFIVAGSWPLVVLPVVAMGLVLGGFIPAAPVVGMRLPREARASAFGVLQAGTFAVQAVATVGAGALADVFGVGPVLVGFAVLSGTVGLYGLARPLVAPADTADVEAAAAV